MGVKSKQMQTIIERVLFSVGELSIHGTSCQPVSWRLPPSTPSRNDWDDWSKDVEL